MQKRLVAPSSCAGDQETHDSAFAGGKRGNEPCIDGGVLTQDPFGEHNVIATTSHLQEHVVIGDLCEHVRVHHSDERRQPIMRTTRKNVRDGADVLFDDNSVGVVRHMTAYTHGCSTRVLFDSKNVAPFNVHRTNAKR